MLGRRYTHKHWKSLTCFNFTPWHIFLFSSSVKPGLHCQKGIHVKLFYRKPLFWNNRLPFIRHLGRENTKSAHLHLHPLTAGSSAINATQSLHGCPGSQVAHWTANSSEHEEKRSWRHLQFWQVDTEHLETAEHAFLRQLLNAAEPFGFWRRSVLLVHFCHA